MGHKVGPINTTAQIALVNGTTVTITIQEGWAPYIVTGNDTQVRSISRLTGIGPLMKSRLDTVAEALRDAGFSLEVVK